MTTLNAYYVNFAARKDASVSYTGKALKTPLGIVQAVKVEIYDMASGLVVQERTFKGAYNYDAACQFAARELGLNDELRNLIAYERDRRAYNALYGPKEF